jgi:rubredoxin
MAGHAVSPLPERQPGPQAAPSYECGVCWTVYDPREGDPLAQIPAGTPFEALPEPWCCPECEAPKHKFMAVNHE